MVIKKKRLSPGSRVYKSFEKILKQEVVKGFENFNKARDLRNVLYIFKARGL